MLAIPISAAQGRSVTMQSFHIIRSLHYLICLKRIVAIVEIINLRDYAFYAILIDGLTITKEQGIE